MNISKKVSEALGSLETLLESTPKEEWQEVVMGRLLEENQLAADKDIERTSDLLTRLYTHWKRGRPDGKEEFDIKQFEYNPQQEAEFDWTQ